MHTLAPLIFTLILLNGQQLKNDWEYRFKVFSIVGIFYFFISPYMNYFFSLHKTTNLLSLCISIATVLFFTGLCLTTIIKKHSIIVTSSTAVILCILFAVYLLLDIKIKNTIAKLSGFYSESSVDFKYGSKKLIEHNEFVHSRGGYKLNIPNTWKKNTLPMGNVFFSYAPYGKILAEARLKCIYPIELDIPSMAKNTQALLSANAKKIKSSCHNAESYIECFSSATYGEEFDVQEKWNFMSIGKKYDWGIDIDILFYSANEETRVAANFILGSVSYLPPRYQTTSLACNASMYWL